MKTLVSLTDFVISQIKTDSTVNDSFKKDLADIRNYALFLKQPLTLGMFVPVDKDGNILYSKPNYYSCFLDGSYVNKPQLINYENCVRYKQAEEKVLFEGFEIRTEKNKQYIGVEGYELELPLEKYKMTIEDLASDWNHIELTESAIKQIGL